MYRTLAIRIIATVLYEAASLASLAAFIAVALLVAGVIGGRI